MSRTYFIEDLRTFLFASALLSLVLGFGVFFDHLADLKEAQSRNAQQAYGFDQPAVVRAAGLMLASWLAEDRTGAPAVVVPPEFANELLHPPRSPEPTGPALRESRPL